jgi:hypothetical protein
MPSSRMTRWRGTTTGIGRGMGQASHICDTAAWSALLLSSGQLLRWRRRGRPPLPRQVSGACPPAHHCETTSPESAATPGGILKEPAAAKAATNRAAISHRARSRPADAASAPIAGGPARLAK